MKTALSYTPINIYWYQSPRLVSISFDQYTLIIVLISMLYYLQLTQYMDPLYQSHQKLDLIIKQNTRDLVPKSLKEPIFPQSPCGHLSLELASQSCQVLDKQFFLKETIMASSSSTVTDTSKPVSDLSLRTSTANRLDYLYEISHVPEDSKIPITDFRIVNPYTVFNKPQPSFNKTIKKDYWSFSSFYCKRICPGFQL